MKFTDNKPLLYYRPEIGWTEGCPYNFKLSIQVFTNLSSTQLQDNTRHRLSLRHRDGGRGCLGLIGISKQTRYEIDQEVGGAVAPRMLDLEDVLELVVDFVIGDRSRSHSLSMSRRIRFENLGYCHAIGHKVRQQRYCDTRARPPIVCGLKVMQSNLNRAFSRYFLSLRFLPPHF